MHLLNRLLKNRVMPERKVMPMLNPTQLKFLQDYDLIIVNGVVTCNYCRGYCGQCGSRWIGLTVEEFLKEHSGG